MIWKVLRIGLPVLAVLMAVLWFVSARGATYLIQSCEHAYATKPKCGLDRDESFPTLRACLDAIATLAPELPEMTLTCVQAPIAT